MKAVCLVITAAFLAAAVAPQAALAGASSDVKPISESDQKKLNETIGNEQDAKIKIAPIGQSDKDNVNKAVDWVEKTLKVRPRKKAAAGKESASPATAPAN